MECPESTENRLQFWGNLEEFADPEKEGWSDGFKFNFIMTGGFGDVEFGRHIFSYLKRIWSRRFT